VQAPAQSQNDLCFRSSPALDKSLNAGILSVRSLTFPAKWGVLTKNVLCLGGLLYAVSVDTGGTFTDVVLSSHDHPPVIGKALTTHARVIDGLKKALEAASENLNKTVSEVLDQTETFIFGTTRATNAVVTRKTPKTALLVTKGFRDILLLRQGGKGNPHDFHEVYPTPYIPRDDTFEINERINSEGEVQTALSTVECERVANLLRAGEFRAVAISLLWATENPRHEKQLKDVISARLPQIDISLSSEVLAQIREYPRTSTTAIDASLKPLMRKYLLDMERDLRDLGYAGPILVSTSLGGVMEVNEVAERPIYLLKSGPAMAPVAAQAYVQGLGLTNNVIVCDTGGTTFDVALVRDGELVHSRETWLGGLWRGELVALPSVDVRSVGAGGGSIAYLDPGGLLKVGPQSAGSEPGPACYGKGGREPTVTDAALVCGYLDPDYFLGGQMALDGLSAETAVGSLASALNVSIERTAYGIIALSNETMIGAIADITVAEGLDPRESIIVGGGGAAGLNILSISRELGCKTVLIPKAASALSACGMQVTDIVAERSGSFISSISRFNFERLRDVVERLNAELAAFAKTVDHTAGQAKIRYFLEARYAMQVWTIDVSLDTYLPRSAADLNHLAELVHCAHERIYAVRDEGSDIEFLSLRARIEIPAHASNRSMLIQGQPGAASAYWPEPRGRRPAYFGGEQKLQTAIFDGMTLEAGARIAGPAIIQEPNTTIVVAPDMTVQVSVGGHYICHVMGEE
jgi:N-methylhydantoinase A